MRIKENEKLDPVGDIQGTLLERRPLPIGRTQFEEWSDRIIEGAGVEADKDSLKFALGSIIMQLGPTEAFKEDGYFILQLRKAAANQTAHAMLTELKEKQKEKQGSETAAQPRAVNGVLEDQTV